MVERCTLARLETVLKAYGGANRRACLPHFLPTGAHTTAARFSAKQATIPNIEFCQ
jgi:hypothetical protein